MNLLTLKLIALLAIPMYLLTTASEGSDENEPKHLPGDLESYLDIDPPETRSGRSHKEEPQHLRGDLEAHLDIDPPETNSKDDGWATHRTFSKDDSITRGFWENGIRALMEKLKEIIVTHGYDPFHEDLTSFDLQRKNIRLDLLLYGITVTGGSNFVNPYVDFNLGGLSLVMDFVWDNLLVHVDRYWLDGILFYVFPLYGKGAADLQVHGLKISVDAHFSDKTDHMTMNYLKFDVTFDSIEGTLEGFLGELSEEINNVINLMGKDIFDLIKDNIFGLFQEWVRVRFNEWSREISWEEFLEMVMEFGDKALDRQNANRQNANKYVDIVIKNARKYLIAISPIELLTEDLEIWNVGFIQAYAQKATFHGIWDIIRTGDATFTSTGNDINISLDIGFFRTPILFLEVKIWYLFLPVYYKIRVTFVTLELHVDAKVQLHSTKKATIEKVILKKKKTIVYADSNGPFGVIPGAVDDYIDANIPNKVKEYLQKALDQHFNNRLEGHHL